MAVPNVPDVLKKIIEVKQQELANLRSRYALTEMQSRVASLPPCRGFLATLKRDAELNGHVALIAEIKKASPSKGLIRADFDPTLIARQYYHGGASCLSVLTDEQFFQGCLAYLKVVRDNVPLPLLRKDFTIDRQQLYEARMAGADAVLLIAACLDPNHLHELHQEALSIGLDVLVEIHTAAEWDGIVSAGVAPPLVGINNRDLHTFELSLEVTKELAPAVLKSGGFLVAESGIFTPQDVHTLKGSGARAILVGESLMRQPDPGIAAKALLARA